MQDLQDFFNPVNPANLVNPVKRPFIQGFRNRTFMTDKLGFWVGFSKVNGIGPVRLQSLLDNYGDIEAAWQANPGELLGLGLDKRAIENLIHARKTLNLEAELTKIEQLGIKLLTWDSPTYPASLKNISAPPIILYVRGNLVVEDKWAVAIVGTRRATPYGKECARLLARGLAEHGITVVSGLAYGIDTEAHRVALERQGRTIAVLGCGVDVVYPPENQKLSQAIAESGALVSEYALGTEPLSVNFPPRNRIISGLSLGVVIVEGSIKSGACITVKFALEQGKEVFAVPGSILAKNSFGPNYFIQNGAKLVMTVNDILDELNLKMVPQQAEARAALPANALEATLIQQLSAEPTHIDELGQATGLVAAEIASTLTMMELKGMIRHVGGLNYVRD